MNPVIKPVPETFAPELAETLGEPVVTTLISDVRFFIFLAIAFVGGLLLGGMIGLLAGYIKGRWDRENEKAVVLLEKEKEEAA